MLYYILFYDISSYIVVCYVMLKYMSLYHNVLYSILIELSNVASSIILPAKTEPIWTLSEPVIKTLCLQMEGAAPPPPPNPPAVFLSRAGLLSRTSHHEQDLHQTRNCLELSKLIIKAVCLQKGGASLFHIILCYSILYLYHVILN